MAKSIVSIIRKTAAGEEIIDFSKDDTMYKFRVEHFRKEINKHAYKATPEQVTQIKALAEGFKQRQGERHAKIFQLQREDHKDFLDALEQHLNILKEA